MAFISEKINLTESFQTIILNLFPIEIDTWVSLALLYKIYFCMLSLSQADKKWTGPGNIWKFVNIFFEIQTLLCEFSVFIGLLSSAFIILTLSSLSKLLSNIYLSKIIPQWLLTVKVTPIVLFPKVLHILELDPTGTKGLKEFQVETKCFELLVEIKRKCKKGVWQVSSHWNYTF